MAETTKKVAKTAEKETTKKPATKKVVKAENTEVKEVAEKKVVAKTTKGKTVKFAKFLQYTGTGRRKQSIARCRLVPNGKGNFQVNGKHIEEYFGQALLRYVANQPLELVGATGKYDVFVTVNGGGLTGQAGAIRHGIARALVKADEGYKAELKKAGFLTRDARAKERKKPGLKKARKAPQFRKR